MDFDGRADDFVRDLIEFSDGLLHLSSIVSRDDFTTETPRMHRGTESLCLRVISASLWWTLSTKYFPPDKRALLLVQNPQTIIRSVRLHSWLIHQLNARRSNLELTGDFNAHGVLLRRVTIKVIHEDRGAVIAEFAVAVPVAPIAERIIQIDAADAPVLFSARGNRIFDHQVLRARAGDVQAHNDHVA